MELTEEDALRAYARMLNTGSVAPLAPLLADDFTYESQWVFDALQSKEAYLEYVSGKLETIRRSGESVFAEMGVVDVPGQGGDHPCVVVAQGSKPNLIAVVLAKTQGGKLRRLDMGCLPGPQYARRSGEYPT